MQDWNRQIVMRVLRFALLFALALIPLVPLPSLAQDLGPAQEVFVPKEQTGPIVVLISGQSGTSSYRSYGKDLADLGYYAVLIDGKDILTQKQDGAQNLRMVPVALDGGGGQVGRAGGKTLE